MLVADKFDMRKLFLIYERDVGRVKIGLSDDPVKRLKQLQTGSPVQLELFAFRNYQKAKVKEVDLHERFQHRRVSGEWFELRPKDYVDPLKEWDFDPGIHFTKRTIEIIDVGDTAFISFDSKSLCRVEVLMYDRAKNSASVRILEKIGRGVGKIGCVVTYITRGSAVCGAKRNKIG